MGRGVGMLVVEVEEEQQLQRRNLLVGRFGDHLVWSEVWICIPSVRGGGRA